jgi:hypothetical protein
MVYVENIMVNLKILYIPYQNMSGKYQKNDLP